jgi:hypothetical protein
MFILTIACIEMLRNRFAWKWILFILLPVAMGFSATSKQIPDAWMLPGGNDMQLYNELLAELKQRNIQHVFSTDALLQWMLNYSGVESRHISKTERINRFTNQVDACYSSPSCKTAVVGYKGFYNYMDVIENWNNQVIIVNDKYFIYESPQDIHLEKGGFEFKK